METPRQELTFLMIKPDGVRRGLIGDIIGRIERLGLKIVGLKMVQADWSKIDNFYPMDQAWITRLGQKTLQAYTEGGYDPVAEVGTDHPAEIGRLVREWLIRYMTTGPLIPIAIRGAHAVQKVRKLAGDTMPLKAEFGTIRGDYATDSAAVANREKRAVFNLVHATETRDEATQEVYYWFTDHDLADYTSAGEEIPHP